MPGAVSYTHLAKVILCSHLGKPKNGPEAKFSLAPVAVALSAKLGKNVVFADDDTYQVQVVSWYDNENSYTSQMVRTIKYFAENC